MIHRGWVRSRISAAVLIKAAAAADGAGTASAAAGGGYRYPGRRAETVDEREGRVGRNARAETPARMRCAGGNS